MSGNTSAHGWPLSVNQREATILIFNFALLSDARKFFAFFATLDSWTQSAQRSAKRAQGFKLKIGHIETETIDQRKLLNHEPAQLNSRGTSECQKTPSETQPVLKRITVAGNIK